LHHLSIGHAFGIGFFFDGSHLGGGDKFHGSWSVRLNGLSSLVV
jgi:hypothetical protein